ncbi:hypothetical protein [Aeromonas sp. QDB08]|uniref:hypothetical protein n=1 Tax=Aeromonas sp. QDB08 TaxID=2990480 RepID=UPI0022E2181B|nr:hypothetical protein [Aeromonas sp. QDB08]
MNTPKLRALFKKAYAANVLHLYQVKTRFDHWRLRHGLKLTTIVLLTAMLFSVFSMPFLQRVAGGYFIDNESLAALRTLLVGTGAALIGAAAIAFSLIVFAMQINVERMPHGLFRQLSSDRRLLSSFLGSFLTAIVIAGTSLIPDGSWCIPAIVTAIWGIVVIMLLFSYAYRRALQLINPIEQLAIMSRVVRRDLQKWSRLADKAAILLMEAPPPDTVDDATELHFNAPKAQFYQANAHWSTSAGQAIHYAISYAKRFAEQGDYEVTDNAFMRMMRINAAYCEAKRGTFVGSNPFLEMPGTTDGFINTSLEQLRQTMQAALAKGDERLAASTLRAIGGLNGVYLLIEYPGRDRSKHHALLASRYLGSAVESAILHDMPDLMMEGIRLMGRTSRIALDHTNPTEIVSVAQKIATLSCVGVLKPSHQPVTLTAFEQLADITYDLMIKGKHDIDFPVRQLRSAVTEAAKRFLETPNTPLSSIHSNTLGPYFSSTSYSSLRGKLTPLVNQLVEAPEDNTRASEIIGNIESWADQLYVQQKELFQFAVEKQSSFTFDAINWAVGISELLNGLSNASACPEHLREKLRRHAVWLVSTLSFIPDDRDYVAFVETYSLTENLFEAALSGYRRDALEFYESCKDLLIGWAKKGGKHETGWGILETSVKGLVALTIDEGTQEAATRLKSQFREMLASEGAPSAEVRARASANLERCATELRRSGTVHLIDRTLAGQDPSTVHALLLEMAGILAVEPLTH